MNKKELPNTDSIQELAKFWDTHDLTDFEDELEEVHEPVFQREKAITLRLPAEEAEMIHKLAMANGLPEADLIHQWVRERIHAP